MEYGVVPKIWKVDYDFLISNYLDKSLWKKSWNLFAYKEHIFTLSLASIDLTVDSIGFRIKKNGELSESVWFYTRNENIKFLKRKINGAIFHLIEEYEENEIRCTDGYEKLKNEQKEARKIYEQEAINYLDEEKIKDDEIRQLYINHYVDKRDNYCIKKQQYVDYYKYNLYYEVYVEFCKATNDESRLHTVERNYHGEKCKTEMEI